MNPTTLEEITLPEYADTWIPYGNAYVCKDNVKLKSGGKIDYHIKYYLNIPTFFCTKTNVYWVVYVKRNMMVSFYQYKEPPWACTYPANYVKTILKEFKKK
jgi:hypothetical protein